MFICILLFTEKTMKQIYINNTLQWFSQLLTKESFQQLFLLGVIVENDKTQPYLLIEDNEKAEE